MGSVRGAPGLDAEATGRARTEAERRTISHLVGFLQVLGPRALGRRELAVAIGAKATVAVFGPGELGQEHTGLAVEKHTAGIWSNTKQRLPFRTISKVPWRTFGHSLAIEAKAWAWQACSGVLAFLSAACATETKATATAVASRILLTGSSLGQRLSASAQNISFPSQAVGCC